MGTHVTVDPTQLRKLGGNLTDSGQKLGIENKDIKGWSFTAAQAGRSYAAEGTRLGAVIGHVGIWLNNWGIAVTNSGNAHITSANAYDSVDDANVTKINAAGVNLG